MKNAQITAYFLARLAVATSMFGHGIVRLPKLQGFSTWMVGQFQKSMLPETLVVPFSYFVPIAELIIGFLLILGLFTRASLIAGSLLMTMLIFGSSMIEEWGSIPSQLLHAAFFCTLLLFVENYNSISIDARFRSRKS